GCPIPEKFDQKFCECLSLGPIEQPGNTFSDLGFVAFGLVILGMFAGPNRQPYPNRMTASLGYTLTYGLVVIFMGPGSMLLHISMTASGGLGDGMSMYMFMGFWIAYNVVRLFDKCRLFFYCLFFGIVILATGLNMFMLTSATLAPMTRKIMLGLGAAAALSQICVWASSKIKTEDFFHGWGYFLLSAGFFAAAFVIWGLTFTGSPL